MRSTLPRRTEFRLKNVESEMGVSAGKRRGARSLAGIALGALCLIGLCACDNDPEGPYEDSGVRRTFDQHWPEYEFAVDQCVAHPALWVIGSKSYAYEEPEKQRKYANFDAGDTAAFNEIQPMLNRLHLKAVYCDRDKEVPGRPLTSVSFIYWYTDANKDRVQTHRIVFFSFNDAKDVADAASVKQPLIPLGRPHWYLSPEKWTYDVGEY